MSYGMVSKVPADNSATWPRNSLQTNPGVPMAAPPHRLFPAPNEFNLLPGGATGTGPTPFDFCRQSTCRIRWHFRQYCAKFPYSFSHFRSHSHVTELSPISKSLLMTRLSAIWIPFTINLHGICDKARISISAASKALTAPLLQFFIFPSEQ